MKKVLIGADPEVFLKDTDTNEVISAIGLIGGSKEEPLDIGEGCKVQEDNILAEFNIPPVSSKKDFIKYINYGKDYLSTFIAGNGSKLHFSSSEIVDDSLLNNPAARRMGCDPTMNAVDQQIREVKICETDPIEITNLRTSGFHIHIGYENPTEEMNERLVLAFELFVSMPLVKYDLDEYFRRSMYGLHGEFRHKDYGVECRSLGGYFIKDDEFIGKVYDNTLKAIKFAQEDISTKEVRNMVDYCIGENSTIIEENFNKVAKEVNKTHKVKIEI